MAKPIILDCNRLSRKQNDCNKTNEPLFIEKHVERRLPLAKRLAKRNPTAEFGGALLKKIGLTAGTTSVKTNACFKQSFELNGKN
jgi:hypothetical protein